MEQQTQNRKSRDSETRVEMLRPQMWRAPETLPSPDPRPGWTHRWVRTSTMGVADPGNISSKLREGYEPCKAEDYPELMMHAATEGRFKGAIEVGGLLLCRIPSGDRPPHPRRFHGAPAGEDDGVDLGAWLAQCRYGSS